MNHRRRAFVRHYTTTGNATEAARRAGYRGSDAVLATTGSQLLRNPEVQKAIEAGNVADERKGVATRLELRQLWTSIAFCEPDNAAENELPVPLRDRLKASELLGKSKGMFVERVEKSGPGGGPQQHEHRGRIQIDMTNALRIARTKDGDE